MTQIRRYLKKYFIVLNGIVFIVYNSFDNQQISITFRKTGILREVVES